MLTSTRSSFRRSRPSDAIKLLRADVVSEHMLLRGVTVILIDNCFRLRKPWADLALLPINIIQAAVSNARGLSARRTRSYVKKRIGALLFRRTCVKVRITYQTVKPRHLRRGFALGFGPQKSRGDVGASC